MAEKDEEEREFDLRWADGAAHKEPSARARMLAAKWREEPPEAVPFRGEPVGRGRRFRMPRVPLGAGSPWRSVVLVFGIVALLIVVLGYSGFQGV
ncbi:SCO2583/SCO2584 N-terminal domain-containing protein [Streptomyces sp. S6]